MDFDTRKVKKFKELLRKNLIILKSKYEWLLNFKK